MSAHREKDFSMKVENHGKAILTRLRWKLVHGYKLQLPLLAVWHNVHYIISCWLASMQCVFLGHPCGPCQERGPNPNSIDFVDGLFSDRRKSLGWGHADALFMGKGRGNKVMWCILFCEWMQARKCVRAYSLLFTVWHHALAVGNAAIVSLSEIPLVFSHKT